MSSPESLSTNGYVVLDVRDVLNEINDLSWIRDNILYGWCNAPELKDPPTETPPVLGVLGASGLPSMFNRPILRKICCKLHDPIRAFMKPLANDGDRFAQCKDRICYRKPGTKQRTESYHRDEVPTAAPDDQTFGGWLNLGEEPNYFYCAPGTHTELRGTDGFAKIKTQTPYLKTEIRVSVLPGHLLIFYDHLAHRVSTAKVKCPSGDLRLFMGWWLGQSDKPLYDNTQAIEKQGIWQIKSGQWPTMHGKLHWINHRGMLIKFSMLFKEHVSRYVASGSCEGKTYDIVPELYPCPEIPTFHPYTPAEIAPFIPQPYSTLEGTAENPILVTDND